MSRALRALAMAHSIMGRAWDLQSIQLPGSRMIPVQTVEIE